LRKLWVGARTPARPFEVFKFDRRLGEIYRRR
jgi:hypothetical protein